MNFARNLIGVFVVCVSAAVAHGQVRNPAFKPIDDATIAAHEKLGGRYRADGQEGLPTIRFPRLPKAKLPEVAVPFGLDLSRGQFGRSPAGTGARPRSAKEVTAFYVRMWVTDQGLKELAPFKNLEKIYFRFEEQGPTSGVTNAGLKELARFEKLNEIDFPYLNTEGLTNLDPPASFVCCIRHERHNVHDRRLW